jgi:hypothetical protein
MKRVIASVAAAVREHVRPEEAQRCEAPSRTRVLSQAPGGEVEGRSGSIPQSTLTLASFAICLKLAISF